MSQNVFLPQSEEAGYLGYYEGKLQNLPPLMVGRIFLTPKYLGFRAYEVRVSGMLGKPQLVPTGKVLGIEMDKVVDLALEGGVRSRKSRPNWRDAKDFERKASGERRLNAKPRPLDGAEKYRQLIVTCETETGLEAAIFEVADPQLLLDKIKNVKAKPRI
ncbi:MAG: hypothetical protein JRN24_03045 [Nitrososphaerota archaeon]|nr:hypothetical protein [Nitrososphaerota archaeon]